jgi:hypothetical protein
MTHADPTSQCAGRRRAHRRAPRRWCVGRQRRHDLEYQRELRLGHHVRLVELDVELDLRHLGEQRFLELVHLDELAQLEFVELFGHVVRLFVGFLVELLVGLHQELPEHGQRQHRPPGTSRQRLRPERLGAVEFRVCGFLAPRHRRHRGAVRAILAGAHRPRCGCTHERHHRPRRPRAVTVQAVAPSARSTQATSSASDSSR